MPHPTPITRRRRNAGFTLTELMVTLAVLGVMVGVAIPSVLAWMPNIYLKDGAYELKGAMIRARSLAINEGMEHRLVLDPDASTWRIERGNLTSGSTVWTTVVGPLPLGNEVTIAATTAGIEKSGSSPVMRFEVDGSVDTSLDTLAVTLTNSHSDTYVVSIQRRTGHPSLMKGT